MRYSHRKQSALSVSFAEATREHYFRSYTSIANQEKDGLEYGQLSATDQKIVDQCVSDSR